MYRLHPEAQTSPYLRRRFAVALLLLVSSTLVSCSGVTASSGAMPSPAVGVPVVDGNVEFVVQGVNCTTDPMSDGNFAPLPPKGQFCKVSISATALEDIGMFLGDITASTSAIPGEVPPDVAAMLYAGALKPDYISKGQTLKGDVVFDIGVGDALTALVVKGNPASRGVTVPIA